MINDDVLVYIVTLLPTITAVLSCLGVALGVIAKFKALRRDVQDKTDLTEYKDQIKQINEDDKLVIKELVDQNYQTQKQMAELITKIDKIRKPSKEE